VWGTLTSAHDDLPLYSSRVRTQIITFVLEIRRSPLTEYMYMHFHHFEVLDLQLAFLGKAVARLKEILTSKQLEVSREENPQIMSGC